MSSPEALHAAAPGTHDDPKTANEVVTEVFSQFHDFDDPLRYESLLDQATSKTAANFAVRFGVEKAEIAINLDEQSLEAILEHRTEKKDDNIICTWM